MARSSRERYTTQFGIGRSADEKTMSSKVDDIDDKWLNKVVEEDREKWKQSKWHTEILDEGEGTYESESSKPCSITKGVANDQSLLDQRESPCTLGSQSRPMATSKARMVQREREMRRVESMLGLGTVCNTSKRAWSQLGLGTSGHTSSDLMQLSMNMSKL